MVWDNYEALLIRFRWVKIKEIMLPVSMQSHLNGYCAYSVIGVLPFLPFTDLIHLIRGRSSSGESKFLPWFFTLCSCLLPWPQKHQSSNAVIKSSNHVAQAQCIKPCRYRSIASVSVHIKHHNIEKCDIQYVTSQNYKYVANIGTKRK